MGTSWPIREYADANIELEVSVAWGADLLADPDTWAWTEITTDVYEEAGISVTLGRNDEAGTTQPAKLTMKLDNRAGKYSIGGESSNWPYVRKGTPIRVRIDPDGSGFVTVYQGNAVGWTPGWVYHSIPHVQLEASGTLRRLGKGASPLESAYRRGTKQLDDVIAYWPMEEGQVSNVIFPDVGPDFLIDPPPWMVWTGNDIIAQTGTPDLSRNTSFVTSKALPVLRNAWFLAYLPWYSASGSLSASCLVEFPVDVEAQATIIGLQLTGSVRFVDLAYETSGSGSLKVYTYDDASSSAYTTIGPLDVGLHSDPRAVKVQINLVQNGANIDVTYGVARSDGTTQSSTGTIVGRTIGNVERAFINSTNDAGGAGILDDVAVGHYVLRNSAPTIASGVDLVTAYAGEIASDRLDRLATENNETVTFYGGASADTEMGPQSVDTYLALLRECETADDGTLFDGLGEGLQYVPRSRKENATAVLTLDATNSELKPEFSPVDDDQRVRNKAVVTRKGAITTEFTQFTGTNGAWVIGTYDESFTVNINTNEQAVAYAQWKVHEGLTEGYRYPEITLDLGASPQLITDLLLVQPGTRVDINNVDSALTYHPGSGPISLLVEGMTHRLTAMTWTVTLRCSLWSPWSVATLDADTRSPVDYKTTGAESEGNNTSLTVALPSQYEVDDLLILAASIRNSGTGTVNTPTGWTPLLTSGNVSIFGKRATNAEASVSVSFTGGVANADTLGQIFSVSGTNVRHVSDITEVVHASAAQLNGSAQNCAMPALTVTEDNCGIVALVWKQDDFSSASNPYSFTEFPIVTNSTLGDDACMFAAWGVQSTATNIGTNTYTITGGAAAISRGILLALRSDPEPGTLRLETPGSTLASSVAAGATSMTVTTTNAAPISYVGIGAIAVGNNASVVPALPGSLAVGDLMLCVAAIRNSGTGTVTVNADWRHILTSGNLTVMAKYYQTGDAAPTVAFSGGVANATTQAQIMAFRGTHPNMNKVIDVSTSQLNGSAQGIAVPGLVATHDDVAMVIIGWKQDDWTSVATLSGQFFTEISDSPTTTGDDAGIEIQYRLGEFSGAKTFTGTNLTVTGGAAAISRSAVIALQPDQEYVWTTRAIDYPLDLDVGGVKITATACSDVASPQVMTIEAAPVARSSGVPVKVWNAPVLPR